MLALPRRSRLERLVAQGDALVCTDEQERRGDVCMWLGGRAACVPQSSLQLRAFRVRPRFCRGGRGHWSRCWRQRGALNAGEFEGRNEEKSSRKIKFDEEEDGEIYCYLSHDMAREGQGRRIELPTTIRSSKSCQGLLDRVLPCCLSDETPAIGANVPDSCPKIHPVGCR